MSMFGVVLVSGGGVRDAGGGRGEEEADGSGGAGRGDKVEGVEPEAGVGRGVVGAVLHSVLQRHQGEEA